MTKDKVTDLEAIAALAFRRSQRDLAESNQKLADLEAKISDLRKAVPSPGTDLRLATFEMRHAYWITQELRRLNSELAMLRVQREDAMAACTRAFGRQRAVQILKERRAVVRSPGARYR